MKNKAVLEKANKLLQKGDIDAFLAFCTEDTEWTFVGERTLKGKESVKQYLEEAYTQATRFHIDIMIEEGDFVMQMGEIQFGNEPEENAAYLASDLWRFRDGKMAELKAFVIRKENNKTD